MYCLAPRPQDYVGAVSDFTSAIRLEPSNADFYHNRGFAHRKQVSLTRRSLCSRASLEPAFYAMAGLPAACLGQAPHGRTGREPR